MELAAHQNQALHSIIYNYKAGESAISIVMPAGSGKTLLSIYVVKEFSQYKEIKSIVYVSRYMAVKDQFQFMRDSYGVNDSMVKAFTVLELERLIAEEKIQKDQFQLMIIDDNIEFDKHKIDFIYDFFECFKIIFSRENLDQIGLKSIRWENIPSYKYSINQAITDSYLIKSQEIDSIKIFESLEDEVRRIGTDWSEPNQKLFAELLRNAREQNAEFWKIQELIISGKIDVLEIMEISRRKDQLEEFEKLLSDDEYFREKQVAGKGPEFVWQNYFEANPWIFGFGLNYIFNSPLEGKGLEQTVAGYSITGHGKRTDALLHTTGLIQTLCFGEIKTHKKNILKEVSQPYRSESWAISDELAGGIAQVQRTIQKSLMNISEALSIQDDKGYKSKNSIYLYKPKSFLIIGTLDEFRNENGDVHEHKFSSFELFRRSITDIEIITFDELYQRAHALVNKKW